ncbi:MAG: DMT family transporter [Pseudomonadota bacterium]
MSSPQARTQSPVAGVVWMLVTGANFVAVTAIVKIVGDELPAAQSAFMRYFLGLVFIIPMLPSMRRELPSKAEIRLFAVRGFVHSIGVMAWFYAMTRITLAEVTALNYLNPVFVTIGAAIFLGERLAIRRILAVVVALMGAMVIVRPGFRELDPGHLSILSTALLFAVSYLIAKHMADRYSPEVVVGWLSVFVTIGLAPFAAAVWVTPSWSATGWIFLVAVFATAGHYSMSAAFRAAPIAVTQPVTFLQLVWATLLGTLAFGEPVDVWVVMGGALIIAAVSFITWREYVLNRRATPTHIQTKS